MSDSDRHAFADAQVIEYARQHIEAGEWTADEAAARSRVALADLLTGGPALAGHTLLNAINAAGRTVGWLWVLPRPAFLAQEPGDVRWLGQITVAAPHRGRGIGRAMLDTLHDRLAEDGVDALWLRVYHWNTPARQLYAAAGYEVVRSFDTDAHLKRRLRT